MSIAESVRLRELEAKVQVLTEIIAELKLRVDDLTAPVTLDDDGIPSLTLHRGPGRPKKYA